MSSAQSVRRICVLPWESPSYCARILAERAASASVPVTKLNAGVTSSDRSGTDNCITSLINSSPQQGLGLALCSARTSAVSKADIQCPGDPNCFRSALQSPLCEENSQSPGSSCNEDEYVFSPSSPAHWSPGAGSPATGSDTDVSDQSESPSGESLICDALLKEADWDCETRSGFGLSLGGLTSSRTLTNLAQLATAMGVGEPAAPPEDVLYSYSMSWPATQPPGFPRKFSTRRVYSDDEWSAMHPNHHSQNKYRHAVRQMFPSWRPPKTDAAAAPNVSPIPEVYDEDEYDKFVIIDRPDWHIPLFVKHTIPDPLGEIPNWYTQEQVDEAEAKITALRKRAMVHGVPGLGIGGIPELAHTIPMHILEQGCLPAKLGGYDLHTQERPYRFPDLSRTPEMQLPAQMQLKLLYLDASDWLVDRARNLFTFQSEPCDTSQD